jgi:hypothetical protein
VLSDNNERLQEFLLMIGDRASTVSKKWWYALAIAIVAVVPVYYAIKFSFIALLMHSYKQPRIIYSSPAKQPLTIPASGVLDLGDGYYSGYIKIRNIEHDWGVAKQEYTADFRTLGGTSLVKVAGSTFVLPSSEKLIVFSRFKASQKPDQIAVSLNHPSNFIRKPDVSFEFDLQRQSVQNTSTGLVVSAGIKNLTPFTIKQINLPVAVYDTKNQIVAVNYTYIDEVKSNETRTFQYSWSGQVAGAVRAEITPEINIFDQAIFETLGGVSPFQNQ